MESMMTARQVAELLGVHENWVYDQAASGMLPSYKIGGTRRFDPDELRGWIAQHRAERRRDALSRPTPATPGRRSRRQGRRAPASEQPKRVTRKRLVVDHADTQPKLFDTEAIDGDTGGTR